MIIQAEHHFEKIHRKKTNNSERKRPSNQGLMSKIIKISRNYYGSLYVNKV